MTPDFSKDNGLIPVVIQHTLTMQVLMLGYMNEDALAKTKSDGLVTFFSRSRNELWTKGSTSGNYLHVSEILQDCDNDALLIRATPDGPTCHTGSVSCFENNYDKGYLYRLQANIQQRIDNKVEGSYTYNLYKAGINKMAQKVGEEAVELVIEAKDDNDTLFKNEAADLVYHLLILLKAKGMKLEDVEQVLKSREK